MSSPNVKMLETVAQAIGSLNQEVVFVGGTTVPLYLQNPASPEVRPTDDVDCIIELSSYISYAKVEERMRQLGFENDISAQAPICRWIVRGIKVDIMPTDGSILGFRNQWYGSGVAHKVKFTLPDGQNIFILSAPFFIGTKIDAFGDRGNDDFRLSTDLDDIMAVIDGRDSLVPEFEAAPRDLTNYVAHFFRDFTRKPEFRECIECFLPASREGQRRQTRAIAAIAAIAKL